MSVLENLKQRADRVIDGWALKALKSKVRFIINARRELEDWSDRELKLSSLALKEDLEKGRSLAALEVEAFSVVNEAARRILKQVPHQTQIFAALVINSGRVAEMNAGEGKTLTETMPVYLNGLTGKGVHLITTNDYLAERDAKWMGKLYDFLGLSVGFVNSEMKTAERQKAYACDITYVANQEIGFDYLRDNLVFSRAERVLRPEHPLHFGIIDEVDSILIDEARTPLIIAEPVKEERNFYDKFTAIVSQLKENEDYIVDYQKKQAQFTDEGLNRVEQILGTSIFSENNPMFVFYLDVCLKARVVFEKDRDYIVDADGVQIVDEFTGRVLPGRRFTDGVHQAIEAKEGVKVKDADRTQASVTFQNFFPQYEKLSGMSGTVMRAREEFNKVYKLDVVQIPTNRPIARIDHHDLFFKTQKGKFMGLLKRVAQIHKKGQPILIGARSVEVAHEISQLLREAGFFHQLLTAKDHEAEAEKVKKAGAQGAITVATNMAGRGTDILMDESVKRLGGLYVIGTERHESRRIDDQLIGRSGRQGEPGESLFLISMEDEIMSRFGSEKIIDAMEATDIPEDEYIPGKSLDEAFAKAQEFVEAKNLDSRLYLHKFDSVINQQRKVIYDLRESLLENENNFWDFFGKSAEEILSGIALLKEEGLVKKELGEIFKVPASALENAGYHPAAEKDFLNEWLNPFFSPEGTDKPLKDLTARIKQRALRIKDDPEIYKAAQNLILEIIDSQWSAHLELMEALKEEASLFSYASQDPLIDFILDGRKLFEHAQDEIKRQFLSLIFSYLEKNPV